MTDPLPPVLDPCCGPRMMYFQKDSPDVLYCDNRILTDTLCDGRRLEITPDVKCDFRELPFPADSFWHVVFDPPHIRKGGPKSWIIKKYGKLPPDWKDYLRKGFEECWRVLKPHGTLVFKWSEEDFTLNEVLGCFPQKPLYGNRARGDRQIFVVFVKGSDPYAIPLERCGRCARYRNGVCPLDDLEPCNAVERTKP